jgi:hypothetical protein
MVAAVTEAMEAMEAMEAVTEAVTEATTTDPSKRNSYRTYLDRDARSWYDVIDERATQ